MNVYFLDSSVLVKRYVHEVGSSWVQAVTASTASNILLVSRITRVEDWTNQYQIVELDQEITERAGQLVQRYPLRAYDSVQLASALSLYPFFSRIDPQLFTFACADDRLLSVAQTEGMLIENPNAYP